MPTKIKKINVETVQKNWDILAASLDFANQKGAFSLEQASEVYISLLALKNEIQPLVELYTNEKENGSI